MAKNTIKIDGTEIKGLNNRSVRKMNILLNSYKDFDIEERLIIKGLLEDTGITSFLHNSGVYENYEEGLDREIQLKILEAFDNGNLEVAIEEDIDPGDALWEKNL